MTDIAPNEVISYIEQLPDDERRQFIGDLIHKINNTLIAPVRPSQNPSLSPTDTSSDTNKESSTPTSVIYITHKELSAINKQSGGARHQASVAWNKLHSIYISYIALADTIDPAKDGLFDDFGRLCLNSADALMQRENLLGPKSSLLLRLAIERMLKDP